jgi:hypothetical protein
LESDTRVTPSTALRRDIIRATPTWLGAQPVSVIAGAWIEPRSGSPPLPSAPGRPMSPLSAVSLISAGTARESSRSARSQSKRAAARPRTVSIREDAIASKSAYGRSASAFAAAAVARSVVACRSTSRCLTELVVRMYPAKAATHSARTPSTM